MRNPKSPFNRHRSPSIRSPSVGLRTPEPYLSYSPSPSATPSSKSTPKRNPVKIAARSVAGAFTACFTPPEEEERKSSSNFDDSDTHIAPSDGSSGSTEKKHRRNRSLYAGSNSSVHVKEVGNVKFTIAEIYKATRNFSPSLKIGQGGFGTVYKGQLKDGTLVAVKRAKKIMYDKHLGHEFQSEVQTLAQVEHLNLVKLFGYLEHEDERILVVEYIPNRTLREHLDGYEEAC